MHVVDRYRTLLICFQPAAARGTAQATALRSKLVLVVWISYCLMDAAACCLHPLVAQYGVSLHWQDLEHLVLPSRAAHDAALSVAEYLAVRTRPDRGLFSLRNDAATSVFARQFAGECSVLSGIWADQQADAARRQDAHWNEVVRKQELAASLRARESEQQAEVIKLANEHAAAQRKLSTMRQDDSYTASQIGSQRAIVRRIQNAKASADSAHAATQARRIDAEKAPPPVLQPLPSDSSLALVWVFHLHMPPMLRHLSRASFLSAQVLLPTEEERVRYSVKIQVQPHATKLCSHYNKHQGSRQYLSAPRQHPGAVGCVGLWSYSTVPAERDVGPKHVDSFCSRCAASA